MPTEHFPLLGPRLRTPRLELRLPSPEELGALADVATQGVHAPDRMPFMVPWTDRPPAEIARGVVQHHWLTLGQWTPDDWHLNLTVLHAGEVECGSRGRTGGSTPPCPSPLEGSARAFPCSE